MLKWTLSLLMCFILNINCFAATTKQQAESIYKKIIQSNGFWIYPKLNFSNSREMNASSGTIYITINQGMLDNTNVDELALVIGHELGHWKLHHRSSTPSNELEADKAGWIYGSAAGYNMCRGKNIFKKFKQRASKTHPHPKDRYRSLPKC